MEKPGDLSPTRHLANPCPSGGAGIVCIDPTTLSATPDPVHVRSGKLVHFFVNGGRGNLHGTPIDQEGHEGAHAWAHAKTSMSLRQLKSERRFLLSIVA